MIDEIKIPFYRVVCDQCSLMFPLPGRSTKEARELAQGAGFTCTDKEDLCPYCTGNPEQKKMFQKLIDDLPR